MNRKSIKAAFGRGILDFPIERPFRTITPVEYDDDKLMGRGETVRLVGNFVETLMKPSIGKICIVVNDKTRQSGTEVILPILLDHLKGSGIEPKQILILIATGAHSSQTPGETNVILGELPKGVSVRLHDSRMETEMEFVGVTSRGTPVYLNRLLIESEEVICINSISYHYFAGFGGGIKSIVPGCAGVETIKENHKLSLGGNGNGLHERCRSGIVTGNPVYEDLVEAYSMLPRAWGIISGMNNKSKIGAIFLGELESAHKQAQNWLLERGRVTIEERADMVIASCGGYPSDINLVQAHKSLSNVKELVSPGGRILLFAECIEGTGSEAIVRWLDYGSAAEIKKEAVRDYNLNAQTAISLKRIGEGFDVGIVTRLPTELIRNLNFRKIGPSDTSGINKFIEESEGETFWIPDALKTIPVFN